MSKQVITGAPFVFRHAGISGTVTCGVGCRNGLHSALPDFGHVIVCAGGFCEDTFESLVSLWKPTHLSFDIGPKS